MFLHSKISILAWTDVAYEKKPTYLSILLMENTHEEMDNDTKVKTEIKRKAFASQWLLISNRLPVNIRNKHYWVDYKCKIKHVSTQAIMKEDTSFQSLSTIQDPHW